MPRLFNFFLSEQQQHDLSCLMAQNNMVSVSESQVRMFLLKGEIQLDMED